MTAALLRCRSLHSFRAFSQKLRQCFKVALDETGGRSECMRLLNHKGVVGGGEYDHVGVGDGVAEQRQGAQAI